MNAQNEDQQIYHKSDSHYREHHLKGLKCFYSYFNNQLWFDIARQLKDQFGIEPIYWVTDNIDRPKEYFPSTVFHNVIDSIKGISPDELKGLQLLPLDSILIKKMSYYESQALKMMDRFDLSGKTFSYNERVRLYHYQVRFILTIIDYFKPDIILFPTTPHMIDDFLLYAVSKIKRFPIVMIERTAFPQHIFTFSDIESGSVDIREKYRENLNNHSENNKTELKSGTENYLNKAMGVYTEGIPFYLKKKLESTRVPALRLLKNIIRTFCYGFVMKIYNNLISIFHLSKFFQVNSEPYTYYKQKNRPIEKSRITPSQVYLYKTVLSAYRTWRLSRHYRMLAQDISFNQPYILVALHNQPEKSTSPVGGVFVNQNLMIQLLSSVIPDDWILIVKEHPSQFKKFKNPLSSKSRVYYDDINRISKVALISNEADTYELIDNAVATATVSSNVGWESIARGKPTLVFGSAWYKDCHGVFSVKNTDQCYYAVNQIRSGFKVNRNKVLLFIKTLEEVCILGDVHTDWIQESNIPYTENVNAITVGLTNAIRKTLVLHKELNSSINGDLTIAN